MLKYLILSSVVINCVFEPVSLTFYPMSGQDTFQIKVSDEEYKEIKALPNGDVYGHSVLTFKMYRELFRSKENYEYTLERLPPATSQNGRKVDPKSQYSVKMKLPVYKCVKNHDTEFQFIKLPDIKTFDLELYELPGKVLINILEDLSGTGSNKSVLTFCILSTLQVLEKDFMDLVACHTLIQYPFSLTETDT